MMAANTPTIPEWLKNRSVFITGGSGLIGKVLIWKILHSCPEVHSVYVLLRNKRGVTSQQRVGVMTSSPMFKDMKKRQPLLLNKIKVINGDIAEPGLGLSLDDKRFLKDNISVVFHAAASVRFDNPLKEAIQYNLMSTYEMVQLAQQMKLLQAFVHISTAYTNCENRVIEEKLYPPRADWRKILAAAEKMKETELNAITEKLLSGAPNTYVYTKQLAEQVVYEYQDQLPIVIYRPSVVCSGIEEPLPGWIDSINSVSGICGAVSKGVLRVYYGPSDIRVDYVPVDVCVNGMIIAAWQRAVFSPARCSTDPPLVINSTSLKYTSAAIREFGYIYQKELPMVNIVWDPLMMFTSNSLVFTLLSVLFQFIPGVVLDSILWINGHKTRFHRINRIMYVTLISLKEFLQNEWTFETEAFQRLNRVLLPADRSAFELQIAVKNSTKYERDSYNAMRIFVFKDPEVIHENTFKHRKRMYWLKQFSYVLVAMLGVWLLPTSFLSSQVINVWQSVADTKSIL